jgi:hypothetical protein
MNRTMHTFFPIFLFSAALALLPKIAVTAVASPAGDACRKEICDSAVAACLQANQSLNPLAATEKEKKGYCAQFFDGCMRRTISADVPWYSPETVTRFLQCPS